MKKSANYEVLHTEKTVVVTKKFLLAAGIVLILLIIPFGVEGDTGNKSWIFLPGLPFGLQPAELVKIPFILIFFNILFS